MECARRSGKEPTFCDDAFQRPGTGSWAKPLQSSRNGVLGSREAFPGLRENNTPQAVHVEQNQVPPAASAVVPAPAATKMGGKKKHTKYKKLIL